MRTCKSGTPARRCLVSNGIHVAQSARDDDGSPTSRLQAEPASGTSRQMGIMTSRESVGSHPTDPVPLSISQLSDATAGSPAGRLLTSLSKIRELLGLPSAVTGI